MFSVSLLQCSIDVSRDIEVIIKNVCATDLEPGADEESNVHSANLPNFSIVDVIPLPISAALLANSDRAPLLEPWPSPMGDPFAACFCDSVSSDCL